MSLRQKFLKTANYLEKRADKVVRKVKRRIYRNTNVTIVPYLGHGTARHLRLKGRVLENYTVLPSFDDDSAWSNLRNIIRRFNSDELPNAEITASFGNQQQTVLSNHEGFFEVLFDLNTTLDSIWHEVDLQYNQRRNASAVAKVMIPPQDAQFAVVSDLDDTVIRSNVPNLIKLLFNTLFKNAHTRLPFAGVAEFYQALQKGTKNTFNPIYYVSNSPHNLYDLISDFFKIRGIPEGPIFLRDFGLTKRYMVANKNHKKEQITRLLDLHPELPFILIGDSGEHDPELYAEIVREYPKRIAATYIRDVRPKKDSKRDEYVQALAQELAEIGTPMLLIPNTTVAARHATEQGFIDSETLPAIEEAVEMDSARNPLEMFIEEAGGEAV
jgi:phosphatidate phosphatase APP1